MLSMLAVLSLLIGAVLLVVGYVADKAQAVRPGWAMVIISVVLFLVVYLAPAMGTYHAL